MFYSLLIFSSSPFIWWKIYCLLAALGKAKTLLNHITLILQHIHLAHVFAGHAVIFLENYYEFSARSRTFCKKRAFQPHIDHSLQNITFCESALVFFHGNMLSNVQLDVDSVYLGNPGHFERFLNILFNEWNKHFNSVIECLHVINSIFFKLFDSPRENFP